MKIENQVQLAHLQQINTTVKGLNISEIPVEDFDVSMYNLESNQLIVLRLDACNEEKWRVPLLVHRPESKTPSIHHFAV